MLVPNLRPKVVPHSGSRLLLGLIVRAHRRLVGRASPAHCPETWPPGIALRKRGSDTRHTRPVVASLPQREGLLALRLLAPALLLPHPLLPEPAQPAYPCPGARTAHLAARPRPRTLGAFGRLPRDGHDPRSGHRASEGMPQGAVLRASYLRKVSLENRVGLRVQGGASSRSAGCDHGIRACCGQLR
jgi:hypothetical protein